jgi:predicted PurR-regulated permease PerM
MNRMFYKKGLAFFAGTTFFVSFLFAYNYGAVDVQAQQLTNVMPTMDTQNKSSDLQNSNWTGSVEISKVLRESFNPLIKFSLSEAVNKSELTIGNNSSAIAAFIHPVNGYLVYVIYLLNDSNEVAKVITDVGTGDILNVKNMTIEEMMFNFHHGGKTQSDNHSFEKNNMMETMIGNNPSY